MTQGSSTSGGKNTVGASTTPLVILRSELHYCLPAAGYALALLLIALTGAIRLSLIGTPPGVPFLFFYPAIAIASFWAGAGPALMAVLLGAAFGLVFFPEAPSPVSWILWAVLGPFFAIGFAHFRYLRDENRAATKELAKFKFIGDHASDWILLLDYAGHIRYANHRACEDLGWTEGELTGRRIESFVSEPQRPEVRSLLESTKAGVSKPMELTFERRHNGPVLIELACTAVRTREDSVIYAAARDIGARKQIAQKLQEVRHWESLGVMAGGLAHDFNNLLTAIQGYASLAKDTLPNQHEALPMLDSIISASDRSADLVRMMLATAGYRPRYNESLQLDRLLDWMLANRSLPVNVTVSRHVESTHFTGDRRSIDTLLWSLIANAAEAYDKEQEGVVRVIIRYGAPPDARSVSFEEGEIRPGEYLGIKIEDRGCGMGGDVLERAFDPFFSTKFSGRGLGLPAVRGIVRAYSGKLLLDTAIGQGTRVEVWLPVAAKHPEQTQLIESLSG